MADSVEYINHLLDEAGTPFRCYFSELKGRTLRMQADARAGDILFRGPLLHKVAADVRNPIYLELVKTFEMDRSCSLDYSPMWYWCGLNSLGFAVSPFVPVLPTEKVKQLKMLFHPRSTGPSRSIRILANALSRFWTVSLTEEQLTEWDEMTVIWTLNCFEHADDPVTYASFFLPSFMSHSCGPTAMWTTIADVVFIRSQRGLQSGDELTVSYLSEDFGLRPISVRRNHLQSTKFFLCDCPRCTSPVDDTRGFRLPPTLGLPKTCFVRFPKFDECACGCIAKISLTEEELHDILSLEEELVALVTEFDGSEKEDEISSRPEPELIGSDDAAERLSDLIQRMGLFHWASIRGLYQLSEYYKSIASYPKAIECIKQRIEGKRKYVRMTVPEMSSGLGWALEDLGDVVLLHVSGSVAAGLSEEARERFRDNWNPRSNEDLETLRASGAMEAYTEAYNIVRNIFGTEHEHAVTVEMKIRRLQERLRVVFI